ncbi:hypothetical protein ENSA5_36170 [Enhygromyxa salina]|uniref:Uncharacterized protein n=1 Tax=Enhygromyxa salina TaxID=215803 RepID=A0A2S9XV02_9BACT|nr:hypothetical protein [Enhygromyxa salina]PRP96541.1 hypothetical protein ENSA5_36170 [Enhygromyxa salina]
MDTANINEQIDAALAIEARKGHLANYLQDRADERGHSLGAKERREALELFEGYVRSVPELLATAVASSHGTPVQDTMSQVMRAAAAYWDEPDDLIPNELGLLGLLDDAYFTLRILQLVSERLAAETGQTLVEDDLSSLDAVVRDILGDLSDVLDELVTLTMTNAPIDELIAKVAEYSGSFILQSAQTSFTGLSIAGLVETRLSFAADPDDTLRDDLIDTLESVTKRFAVQTRSEASVLALHEDAIAGTKALAQVLDDHPRASSSDNEAIVALLIGALVVRIMAGEPADRAFIERCVDLMLED